MPLPIRLRWSLLRVYLPPDNTPFLAVGDVDYPPVLFNDSRAPETTARLFRI